MFNVKVGYDEEKVWVKYPLRWKKSMNWEAVKGVMLQTTDEGPFVEDVFWHICGEHKVLTYPASAIGVDDLMKRLQKLEGFDSRTLLRAIGCCENEQFVLWDHLGRNLDSDEEVESE